MTRPAPEPGLVIRFDYLWLDEKKRGRIEGSKDRPCAVILALAPDEDGRHNVLLAAITHTAQSGATRAIEIPQNVKTHLSLDHERSWIITSETNLVEWNDPGIVPIKPGQWTYGKIPAKLWQTVRNDILEQRAKVIRRI